MNDAKLNHFLILKSWVSENVTCFHVICIYPEGRTLKIYLWGCPATLKKRGLRNEHSPKKRVLEWALPEKREVLRNDLVQRAGLGN